MSCVEIGITERPYSRYRARSKQRQVREMRGVAHSGNASGPVWLPKGSAQRTVGNKTRKVVEGILWKSHYACVKMLINVLGERERMSISEQGLIPALSHPSSHFSLPTLPPS